MKLRVSQENEIPYQNRALQVNNKVASLVRVGSCQAEQVVVPGASRSGVHDFPLGRELCAVLLQRGDRGEKRALLFLQPSNEPSH